MKKIVLALAAAAAIAAASVTPASALTIIKPIGGRRVFHPHWGFGGGISVGVGVVDPGFSAGYYGGCYTTYRKVLIPNIGIVLKKQVVCG